MVVVAAAVTVAVAVCGCWGVGGVGGGRGGGTPPRSTSFRFASLHRICPTPPPVPDRACLLSGGGRPIPRISGAVPPVGRALPLPSTSAT